MANQTLTTGTPSARVNFDSTALSGLLNGETITINGGHILFDGDVRWGHNAAVVDTMAISATEGGSILMDGTQVWEVPFSASSGNVPAVNVAGSNAISGTGITGELFRVWATGSLTPAASGDAMPATGWIKLRSKTGTFSNGLVVTLPGGATVTCSDAGKRSWIHIVGEEAGQITLPRLGTFTITGDWYQLGETNGNDDQTFQFPVADACPSIYIEKSVGSYATDGDAGLEIWNNAGGRWGTATAYVSQDERGKFFGMDNATGIITIARRSSNACGFKPVTGLKVFIPNVILSNSTSTNFALNTLNATLATRYDFVTTSAGKVDISKASMNWYLSCTSSFSTKVKYSGLLQSCLVSNTASDTEFDGVGIGVTSTTDFTPVTLSNLFSGIKIKNSRFTRYQFAASGNTCMSLADVAGVDFDNVLTEGFGNTTTVTRGNASVNCMLLSRCLNIEMKNCKAIGGRAIVLTTCTNAKIKDLQYADAHIGLTTATNGVYAVTCDASTSNVMIEGFSNFAGLANMHPYLGVLTTGTGANNIETRNIGTPTSEYNCGSTNAMANLAVSTVSLDLKFRRCYLANTRTGVFSLANTVQNVVIENVWGDGADSTALACLNVTPKGCRWTNSTTGQASCYGRHWEDAFTSTTAGRILIACNEPLPATADQVVEGFSAGSGWTSGGQLSMATIGDYVEWTMPYFAIGITALANSAPTLTGTNTGNHAYTFQFDLGSGWNGTWLTLNAANLSGVGAIVPETGIRLKVRATVTVASATNALTYIRVDTVTTATDQRLQYPLPRTQLTVTGFEPGSDVVIYDANAVATGDGANVLATGDAVTGSFVYDYENTPLIHIGLFKTGFIPQTYSNVQLTTSNSTIQVQQRPDRNYQ